MFDHTKQMVGLDFETYSDVDLPKHGLDRYTFGEHFRPLLAAVVWYDRKNPHQYSSALMDFVEDYDEARRYLIELIKDKYIVAHNAGFEQAVLHVMGIPVPSNRFIDSAVLARAAGAAGKLEAAAPQLLGVDKLESGYQLIKQFSIPGPYQEEAGSLAFDPRVREENIDDWAEFARYCAVDAELSLRIAGRVLPFIRDKELSNMWVTMDMNQTGWYVDLPIVLEMQRRYLNNQALAEVAFRDLCDAADLNLNSFPQLQAWCAKRGVKASSFDEAHVERMLKSLDRKMESPTLSDAKRQGYADVVMLLRTKQLLGGSSLKKLQTIVDTVGLNGRLKDQYLHIGAGATFRTTGRGVQMQNLKRLGGSAADMEELLDDSIDWDNDKLASNLRQVFTARDSNGQLIVGDFSSVESRGLAWQAGEQWKLDAYAQGKDLYKVQAGLIFNKPYDLITKNERQIGKVGELACGYGAGGEAVRAFAEKMGVELTEGEAAKLVSDWRTANPRIVQYWADLDAALHMAIEQRSVETVALPYGWVRILPTAAPQSLINQTGIDTLLSLHIDMMRDDGTPLLSRVIHGTRIVGRNIQYFKPSERKTGDLWTDEFTDPKTKRLRKYTVYGGKLSGLLTQSLCREIFFDALRDVHRWAENVGNVELVGQFHDEIVLDWSRATQVGDVSLTKAIQMLEDYMSHTTLPGFPLAAEIKYDRRYTK
jgi:DNA polymerase